MSDSGKLTIVIQAGGESRRMGRSKATVPFLGEPLLLHGVNRLLPLADEFIVTTNEPDKLDFLEPYINNGSIRLVTDISDTRGALHGFHTAFAAATKEFIAPVACDMIFPSRNLISAQLTALREAEADAAVPITQYGYEPFHGVYRRTTCLAAIQDALASGEVRANSWFGNVSIVEFDGEAVAAAEPRGGCFINVNTPEELAAVERKILDDDMRERERFKNSQI